MVAEVCRGTGVCFEVWWWQRHVREYRGMQGERLLAEIESGCALVAGGKWVA